MDAMQKFLEYTSAYDDGSDTRIKLKIIHTQRVTEVMEQLTAALPLSESDRELAYLCAVYHDIGRFEQLKRYHTFLDYKSIDHAQLGCEILRQGDFLGELSDREREQVLTAIGNHNRLAIEDGLDEKTLLFAKLIRDADKCDIFRVFAQEDPVDTTGFSAEQVGQEAVSDVVYESILSKYCLRRTRSTHQCIIRSRAYDTIHRKATILLEQTNCPLRFLTIYTIFICSIIDVFN